MLHHLITMRLKKPVRALLACTLTWKLSFISFSQWSGAYSANAVSVAAQLTKLRCLKKWEKSRDSSGKPKIETLMQSSTSSALNTQVKAPETFTTKLVSLPALKMKTHSRVLASVLKPTGACSSRCLACFCYSHLFSCLNWSWISRLVAWKAFAIMLTPNSP